MKKIIAVVVLLLTTLCYAEEEQRYNFWLSQAPMVCGTPSEVQKYVENNGFTPINLSFGRESSNPNGEIVFMVTYYINEYNQTLATFDTQAGTERCIIFHTFNMRMNESLLGEKGA